MPLMTAISTHFVTNVKVQTGRTPRGTAWVNIIIEDDNGDALKLTLFPEVADNEAPWQAAERLAKQLGRKR